MRGRDAVIAVREAALDTVLGGAVREVLNAGPVGDSPIRFLDLAANLGRAMHQVKTNAIDESGRRVDYAGLARSPAFAAYRGLTPALRELNPAHIVTRQERLAFWLNLHNALVIDGVITYGIRQRVPKDVSEPSGSSAARRTMSAACASVVTTSRRASCGGTVGIGFSPGRSSEPQTPEATGSSTHRTPASTSP